MNVEDAARHLLAVWTELGEDPDEFDPLEYALDNRSQADPEGNRIERAVALLLADAERRLHSRVFADNLVPWVVVSQGAQRGRLLAGSPGRRPTTPGRVNLVYRVLLVLASLWLACSLLGLVLFAWELWRTRLARQEQLFLTERQLDTYRNTNREDNP